MDDYGPGTITGQYVRNNIAREPLKSASFPAARYENNIQVAQAADPNQYFKNVSQNDFHLAANSPALNAGKNIAHVTCVQGDSSPDVNAYESGDEQDCCCWQPGPNPSGMALPWNLLLLGGN